MKKIVFVSRVQLAFCIVFALMSTTCFIGMFFNPFHGMLFVMSVILTIASYNERKW